MSDEKILRAEYDELKKNLLHHRWLYDYGQPEIEDYEYDQLMIRLKEIEKTHPDWIAPDSPTQIVEIKSKDADVEHDAPMLSIDDVFSTADVNDFIDKITKKFPDAEFLVEEKVDGVSAAMRYRNGRLIQVLSRGDGKFGKDITANAFSMIDNLIVTLDNAPTYIELRGEIFISRKIFDRINADRIENELEPFANPRNYTAGLMNSKNKQAPRQLSFVVHDMMAADNNTFEKASDFYSFLAHNGVNVIYKYKVCRTAEEVLSAIEEIGASRQTLDWALDGAVVKLNSFAQRSDLGTTAKAPRWSIAYKFPPERKQPVIREIELNIGRTGRITPVAIFDPIVLAGTTVSRATLHNKDYIQKLDVRIGSTIEVFKSGEIIPKVEKVVSNPDDSTPYKFIEECPSCGSKLDMDDWRCLNPKCPAQIEAQIVYFAGKNALDIEGLGKANIHALLESGLVKNIADLFELNRDDLIQKCKFGSKETDNLLSAIEKAKAASPEKILTGLGIEGVGDVEAESLLAQAKSIDRISKATHEELHDWLSKSTKQSAQNVRTVFDELAKGDECDLFLVLTKINNVREKTANRLLEKLGNSIREASLLDLYKKTIYSLDGLQNLYDFFRLHGKANVDLNKLLKLTKLRTVELLNSIDSIDKLDLINGIGKTLKERLKTDKSAEDKKRERSFEEIQSASMEQLIVWCRPNLKNVYEFFHQLNKNDPDLVNLMSKIKLIDNVKAEKLRDYFGTLETIKQASLEELQKCLWSPVARKIFKFFELEENKILIERLKTMGLNVGNTNVDDKTDANIEHKDEIKIKSKAGGETIVFTGTLTINRAEAGAMAQAAGFTVKKAITKGTKYLVVGEKSGSKLQKAEELGITILNEEQFYQLIKHN